MATIHQFTQYLFALNPQANAARFSWFNFLKNHCEGSTVFDIEVINRFIRRALSHPYWQNNRQRLADEIHSTLENFLYKKASDTDRRSFNLNHLINVASIQIVAIEDLQQLKHIITHHLQSMGSKSQRYKVILNGKKQAIVIRMLADKSFEVLEFDNLTLVYNGRLIPLIQDQVLYYGPDLELSLRHVHHISVAPHTTARFIINNHNETRISGSLIKDHTFQKYDVFTAQLLRSLTRIFYPIKQLEQYFIDPKSEPYYQELTQYLERVGLLIQGNHPDSFILGKNAIEKGQMAMDSLYPGDKHLLNLIKGLESILNNRYGPRLEAIQNNGDGKRSSAWDNLKTKERSDLTALLPSVELPAGAEPINS